MVLVGYFTALAILAVSAETGSDFSSLQQDYQLTSADYFDPEEYQVGFGDNIWISFPGGVPFARTEESISTIILPVGLDGILSVPGMPPISVDGLNLAQLQSIIEEMVRGSYGSFAVTSGLARSANFEVPVTGQVGEPGIVTVNGLTRLNEAINEAGGATATAAVSNILVVTVDGDSSFYNLNEFLMNGALSSNPLMRRNSRIHVFPSRASIILEGALGARLQQQLNPVQPTEASSTAQSRRIVLEYIPGETPSAAVQRAGGVTEHANFAASFVSREEEDGTTSVLPFDVQSSFAEFDLEPGDRIVVPFSDMMISIVGQVNRPSSIPYSPGMTVNYYIGMAGGFTGAARTGSLKIVHPDGSKEDAELCDLVPPGSMIEVPRVPIQFWQEYLAILTGVATVIISYQSISN